MYCRLTRDNWNSLKFIIDHAQKDYQLAEKDKVDVFVYGYPFDSNTNSWLSANEVYQRYSASELDFINDIDGVYTILILDKAAQKCFIIVDRYGIYTLYYLSNQNHLVLSDLISELTPHLPEVKLNRASIIEYLNFGIKLGNKTHIEGISEFESGRVYTINQKLEMTERTYWGFTDSLGKAGMTGEEFFKTFNDRMATVMSLSGKVSLPLTGGLDTRSILSACLPWKERMHCYTHGTPGADDVKLARAICHHFGIRHSFYELSEEWIKTVPSLVEKNAEMFNGLVPIVTFMHVAESYAREESEGEVFISGNMGNEIWRSTLARSVENAKGIDNMASILVKRITNIYQNVTGVYRDYTDQDVMDLLKDSIKAELLKFKDIQNPVTLSEAFAFGHYCSNWTSNTLKATGRYFKVVSAFLHKDLLQQIPLMKLNDKVNGSMQKYIIKKNSPYLANLPLAAGRSVSNNIVPKVRGYAGFLLIASRFGANLISRRLFRKEFFRLPYFTDYPGWLRTYHRKFLFETLNYDQMATRELFKREELKKTVNSFLNGDGSLFLFISGLVSLEVWLKKVLGGKN